VYGGIPVNAAKGDSSAAADYFMKVPQVNKKDGQV
jgi:hypothetical protein